MEWVYVAGRVAGVIVWPLAVAAVIYAIGWLVASQRPPHEAERLRGWFRIAAGIGFFAMLAVTLGHFLRYLSGGD